MVAFTVNGQRKEVAVDGNTPLLWVLREHLRLTGTKFGCGIASCGACTVHIDGKATRSCVDAAVALVEGKRSPRSRACSPDGSHPLQKAWIAEQVPQCGYCQSGQIMQAAALLAQQESDARADRRAHGRQHLPLRHLPAHHQRDPARGAGGLSHDTASHPTSTGEFPRTPPPASPSRSRSPPIRRDSSARRCGRGAALRPMSGSRSRPTAPSPSCRRPPRWGRASFTTLPSSSPRSSMPTGRRSSPCCRRRGTTRSTAIRPTAAFQTSASASVHGYFKALRIAGAQARRVLLDAAAAKWNVPVGELSTEPSVVVHKASNRRISYGEIAAFAKAPAEMPKIEEKDLKPTAELPSDRQGHAARRGAAQGHRRGEIRDGCAGARHGLRRGAAIAVSRRRAGDGRRRRGAQDGGHHRRCETARRRRRHRHHGRGHAGRQEPAQGHLDERAGQRTTTARSALDEFAAVGRDKSREGVPIEARASQSRDEGRGKSVPRRIPDALCLSRADGAVERDRLGQRRRQVGRNLGRHAGAEQASSTGRRACCRPTAPRSRSISTSSAAASAAAGSTRWWSMRCGCRRPSASRSS